MEDFLNYVNSTPWLNVIFIGLTLISIILAFYFYFKSKKVKKPTYAIRSNNLIREKVNKIVNVEINYKGNIIQNLTVSKIAIWNAGKETISNSDIAQKNKFRIELMDNDTEILDFGIIYEKNSASGFTLKKKNKSTIEINFDYFDYNEGVIIQVYHTGTNSSSLQIEGAFKGINKINRSDASSKILPDVFYKLIAKTIELRMFKKILGILTIIIPILMMFSVIFTFDNIAKPKSGFVAKIIILSFITSFYWWIGYKMIKRKAPKGFEIFEDNF